MNKVTQIILLISIALTGQNSFAGSATWNASPTNNDWNTAANWTPATVPNDPSAVATFDVSSITTISQDGEFDVAELVFNPGASAFTIFAHYPGLNIYGAGITNNSGAVQTLGVQSDLDGDIHFYNSATAGENTILFERGEPFEDDITINFHDSSSAGSATIINFGNFLPFGGTYFVDSATAAGATIFNRSGGSSGTTTFYDTSKAGSATIVCETGTGFDDGGVLSFRGKSSAENATVIVYGAVPGTGGASVTFDDTATADNASVIINGGINGGLGGTLSFEDGSFGGTAQVKLSGNGTLDLTAHDPGTVSIGSLAGTGIVSLGTTNLTVGTNNLTTEFSGKIQDNAGAPAASFTKTGSGNLALSGANAYDGGTIVQGKGTLFVNNVTGSATGSGLVQVISSVLGGTGIISGPVIIGNSVPAAAILMPGRNDRKPGLLTIGNTLTFNSDGTYRWLLNAGKGIASSVTANGVTINSTALFSPTPLQSGTLSGGTVFTVINNTAATPIAGTFSNLPDGGTITVGNNTFRANYEGGDGNDLTLAVQ